MPSLIRPRVYSSACSLGDSIYIVGGARAISLQNTIEKLSNADAATSKLVSPWKLIVPQEDVFARRALATVVALN